MDIYVVQPGDTIEEIADNFGVSVEKLILYNELINPNNLLVGQVIVIVHPSETYIVREGDTLSSIAASFNITVNELLRNNPFIIESKYIYPGEELTISYNRSARMAAYGYTNTFINRQTLKKTLPYLTYLSIIHNYIGMNGEIVGSDEDIDIIQMAIQHGVIPLMHLATIAIQGETDIEFTFRILSNNTLQNRVIENALTVLKDKGYYGVIISAQLINSDNQDLFYNFAKKFSERLGAEGYITLLAIDPNAHTTNGVVTFEPIDYSRLSEVVYSILFLQYTWGVVERPPSPVFSTHVVSTILEYFLPSVNPDKVSIGIPAFSYIWDLPYIPGRSNGNSITRDNIINLALEFGVTIQFDEESQTPYFIFNKPENNNSQYIVWFVNAITVDSLLKILVENGVSATGVWNIMSYYAHFWLVLNSQYEIIKLLPEF